MIWRKYALVLCLLLGSVVISASARGRGVARREEPEAQDNSGDEWQRETEGGEGLAGASEPDDEAGSLAETKAPTEAGSRSDGGLLAGSPPHWLNGMWAQDEGHKLDGRFAGLAIRLNDDTFLAHADSCLAASGPGDDQTKWAKQRFDLNMPDTLDINGHDLPHIANSSYPSRLFACSVQENLPWDRFTIYKYKRLADKGKDLGEPMDPDNDLSSKVLRDNPLKEKPQIQNDVAVNTDCYMYSYSILPVVPRRSRPRPRSRHRSRPHQRSGEALRKFVKTPVEHKGCTNFVCNFKTSTVAHGVCPSLSDVGAPIMCGGSNKISHVVSHGDTGPICGSSFTAYHLAPNYEAISKYIV